VLAAKVPLVLFTVRSTEAVLLVTSKVIVLSVAVPGAASVVSVWNDSGRKVKPDNTENKRTDRMPALRIALLIPI
jgi:hypothetical protein